MKSLIVCPCGNRIWCDKRLEHRKKYCSNECKYIYMKRPTGLKYNIKVKNNGWFKGGHISWNNGKSGMPWRGAKHPFWKGGIYINKKYIYEMCREHPLASKRGYILQSRLLMKIMIGRDLKPEEVVHHIDGNPLNNQLHNLKLFPNQAAHMKIHRIARARGRKNE